MQATPTISMIGPGVMAEAFIAGFLRQKVTPAERIRVSGPNAARLQELQEKYSIVPYTDNRTSVQDADIVVLAVKPQRLEKVLEGLNGGIPREALVLSIVAGATIQQISSGLDHPCVVRSMPNTPAQIGEGITVWTGSPDVSTDQREQARRILTALGDEIYVEEEHYLDMATALSGTGPAYVFLFMEAMIDAGVHLGFPRRIAEQLVTETLRGSVDYYDEKKSHIARLRNEVTSPGGTSAAALYYLEKAGFRTAISRAIWAAYERSQELGRGKSSQSPEGTS
ncbi:MAG TPA: pyrroline-5-carboxylate reductase [Anaerolineaceae bacterium]|nr:pyrroline-5-carboxylate reductase [Anaerolineaceae bacterium]